MHGNMAEVYSEFWRMHEFAERIEAEITAAARLQASLEAEITEGATANWYLVHARPGEDERALRWLARRRFGCFRPMTQRRQGEARVQGWQAAFPGWLFVFAWNIQDREGRWIVPKERITNVPGVSGMLCDPASGKPVPIPDVFVQEVRAWSWDYNDHAPRAWRRGQAQARSNTAIRSKARKPTKRERTMLDALKGRLKDCGLWTQSTLDSACGLAPNQRIALYETLLHARPSGAGCATLNGAR
jgi:hypothetical protein